MVYFILFLQISTTNGYTGLKFEQAEYNVFGVGFSIVFRCFLWGQHSIWLLVTSFTYNFFS